MCAVNQLPAPIKEAQEKFALACNEANSLEIVGNVAAAFNAVGIVTLLREALTEEVMQTVFMPLMNTKIGFMTDRTGKPDKRGNVKALYTLTEVRECLIDAVIIGLLPTGNQFNILAGTMYPTKEGYTALLKKKNVRYVIEIGQDKSQNQQYAELACKINYEYQGERNSFTINVTVAKNDYSSNDQIRGKAERKAKKALYEYVTGSDFGDGDETSTQPEGRVVVDAIAEEIKTEANAGRAIGVNVGTCQSEVCAYKGTAACNAEVEKKCPNYDPPKIEQPAKEAPAARDGRGTNKPNF